MLFRKGDIVVTNREDMLGIPMTVIHLSNELRLCECEYWIDGQVFWEDFRFDELTAVIEVED